MAYELFDSGHFKNRRHSNTLDGASPYYRCYPCKDGKWVAVGALEMKFRDAFADVIGIPELADISSSDPENWPGLAERGAVELETATREEWRECERGTKPDRNSIVTVMSGSGSVDVGGRRSLK